MPWYVAGTATGALIRVEQAGEFPRLTDFTANLPAGTRNTLLLQDGWTNAIAAARSSTIVGGTVHTTSGLYTAFNEGVPQDVAGQKEFASNWYIDAMINYRKEHWPYATATNAERSRSQRVNNVELPHWLADQYGLMIGVIDGDVFPTYTNQQKIDLLTHLDAHLRGGRTPAGGGADLTGNIVRTWYLAGIELDASDSNAIGWGTDARGYSDFVDDTGVLRTPDYTWTLIPGLAAVMSASTFSLPAT